MNNPFAKKPTLGKKISQKLHDLPHPLTKKERRVKTFQHWLLYLSIFIAGYVVALVQNLLTSGA